MLVTLLYGGHSTPDVEMGARMHVLEGIQIYPTSGVCFEF